MKKNLKKIIIIILAVVVLALIVGVIAVFSTTKSFDDIKTDFINQSEINATEFAQSSILENDDYITYVAENNKSLKSEMYLVRSTFGRFKTVDHFVGKDNAVVDYDYSKVKIGDKEKTVFLIYSSKDSNISTIECEFADISGNIQYAEKGVSCEMPFAIGITLNESDMELTAVRCLDKDGEILFSYGSFVTVE